MPQVSRTIRKIVLYLIFMSFVLLGVALAFSEIAFYLQFKAFYNSHSSSVLDFEAEDVFKRYRKPFAIKKDHRFRILTIGGSTTYGYGLPEQLSWPALLGERLDKEYPSQFEVINLGRVGGHLEEFILNHHSASKVFIPREKWISSPFNRPNKNQLAAWGWKDLNPDLIILAPVINDLGPDYLVSARTNTLLFGSKFDPNISGLSRFIHKFALSHYIQRFSSTIMVQRPDSAEIEKSKLFTIRESYRNNLEKYLDLWKEEKVVLLGLPLLFQAKDGRKEVKKAGLFWNLENKASLEQEVIYLPKLEALGKEVRSTMSSKKGVVVNEIGVAIKEKPFNKRLRLYLDSIHANAEGTALIADEIFNDILPHLSFKPLKKEQFRNRKMKSALIQLENADFELHTLTRKQLYIPGWTVWNKKNSKIKISAGYQSASSLKMVAENKEEEGDEHENRFRVSTTAKVPESYRASDSFFSVSAWVWSDKPLCASLRVESKNGKNASSFPHSGNSSWEYLTVSYPFLEANLSYDISFINRGCTAKIDQVQPVLIRDDRFKEIHNGGYKRFRERITYNRDHRIRIIIVGNSTIWGQGGERNSTISYLLQSKLESLYPNTFEVVNYGVPGWTLPGQIVSVNNNYYFDRFPITMENIDNVFLPNIPRIQNETPYKYSQSILNAVGIKALNPDVVILGSLWNDIGAPMVDRRGFYRIRLADNELLHVKFYRSMFEYADQPSPENKKRLLAVIQQIRSMKAISYLKEYTFPVPDTIEELDSPVNQQRAIDSYNFYIMEFISRVSRWSDVWLLNLPDKSGPNILNHLDKVPNYFGIKNRKSITKQGQFHWYWLYLQGKMQKEVMQRVSEERDIPFVDTGSAFHNQFSGLNSIQYANMDIFMDPVHFTNLGNTFVADRIFEERKDAFAKMALEKSIKSDRAN